MDGCLIFNFFTLIVNSLKNVVFIILKFLLAAVLDGVDFIPCELSCELKNA